MLFTSLAILVASSIAAALPFANSTGLDSRQSTCPKYIVIEAPGLGDLPGYWTGPTTSAIQGQLAGGQRYPLKTVPPPDDGKATPQEMIVQSASAANEIVTTVATKSLECPGVKFVLIGYSYGSVVAVLAMNNPALLRTSMAAVILYGNCFWHPGRTENRGTATSGTSGCGGLNPIGTPLTFSDITVDFCNKNDYLCAGAPKVSSRNARIAEDHWSYRNSRWQADAAGWAVRKLQDDLDIPILLD